MAIMRKRKKMFTNYDENPVEAIRDIAGGVGKGIVQDVVGGVAQNTLSQIFGLPKSGDLQQNSEINFDELEQYPKTNKHIPEIRPMERMVFSSQQQEISRQIESLRQELKALINSSNMLVKDVEKVMMENSVDPGVYHVTFFERLRSIIKLARQQIAESQTWLQLMSSKKKKRGYWNMYKKHGTTFGLSGERTLATQTG